MSFAALNEVSDLKASLPFFFFLNQTYFPLEFTYSLSLQRGSSPAGLSSATLTVSVESYTPLLLRDEDALCNNQLTAGSSYDQLSSHSQTHAARHAISS